MWYAETLALSVGWRLHYAVEQMAPPASGLIGRRFNGSVRTVWAFNFFTIRRKHDYNHDYAVSSICMNKNYTIYD